MAIPFHTNLKWEIYKNQPDWYENASAADTARLKEQENVVKRAAYGVFVQPITQTCVRGKQFLQDTARLILKESVRSIWTPVWKSENWSQRERVKVNVKLAGYSLVQLAFVPVKFVVAIAALAMVGFSYRKAQALLDKCERWTSELDGRASRLEALKGGREYTTILAEFNGYKEWLYRIPADLCLPQAPGKKQA